MLPNPLDEINPALRPLIQSAAANSWKMDMQDILLRRAEAVSMRYSSSNAVKVSASANVGFQIQDTGAETSDGWKYKFDVYARKPLYTWGAAEADHRYGLLEVERVKQDRQLAFLAIYRDVVNRFIDYAILKQRVLYSSLAEEIYRADIELRREQLERGEFPATQFATMELNYKTELLKHEALENSLQRAADDLHEVIGSEETTSINMGGGIPAVADDLSIVEAKMQSFFSSMDATSLKVASKQTRLTQELERLNNYEVNQKPKLNGLVQLRRDSDNVITGNRQNLEYTEGFAGLEVRWNVYDGKYSAAFIKDALQTRRQLERELADIKKNLKDDIGFYFKDLEIKREQSLLSDQTFYWEEGRYRQMEEDVKAGRSPEKDLKAVKRDLERARIVLLDTRGRYYKSLTNLYVMLEYPSILAYLEE
ncbi:TolC family protein [Opitutia bacterium ISCC 52]|nr:TolC family protein [Opitutae bacterium ISCC 52]